MTDAITPTAVAIGTISVDVFNIEVGVFHDDAERVRALADVGVQAEPAGGAAWATAHKDVGPDGHAWFAMVIKPEATRATWAHECVHLSDWIMDHIGAPTDASNTEVRAYLVGHLFAGLEAMLEGERK